jgi:hypothetical protein
LNPIHVCLFPRRVLEFAIFADFQKPIGSAFVRVEGDVPGVGIVIHRKDGEIDAVVVPMRMIRFGGEGLVDEIGQSFG